jgi:threonine/homoserine/homoserine lactone efflux protein
VHPKSLPKPAVMLTFLLASLLIELTPGPNMTWLAALGVSRGRVAALAATAIWFLYATRPSP